MIIAGGRLSLSPNDYESARGKTLILKLVIDKDGLIRKSSRTIIRTEGEADGKCE